MNNDHGFDIIKAEQKARISARFNNVWRDTLRDIDNLERSLSLALDRVSRFDRCDAIYTLIDYPA